METKIRHHEYRSDDEPHSGKHGDRDHESRGIVIREARVDYESGSSPGNYVILGVIA